MGFAIAYYMMTSASLCFTCVCVYIISPAPLNSLYSFYCVRKHTCFNLMSISCAQSVSCVYETRSYSSQVKVHSFFLLCYSSQLPQPVSVVWADWIICAEVEITNRTSHKCKLLLIWYTIHENWSHDKLVHNFFLVAPTIFYYSWKSEKISNIWPIKCINHCSRLYKESCSKN